MLNSNKSIKSHNNSSYGSTYYSYYNHSIANSTLLSKSKRLRVKDSYVEIAKEKKDFISYEVVQIKGYSERNKSKTIFSKSQSCPRFINNKNKKNKIFRKKNGHFSCEKKEENKETDYDETLPYSTTLRNFSSIINNKKMSNLLKNKERINNTRKRNYFGGCKISNKIKELLKTGSKKDETNLNTIKKEENSTSVRLEKISIETYTLRNKKNDMINNYLLGNDNKIKNLPEKKNEIINSINNLILHMNNKNNLINNESSINNSTKEISSNNRKIIGKENYEEEKNIDKQNKTELENKIQQYLQKKNLCIERAKSLLIRNNKEQGNKTIIKNYIKLSNTSCPKVIHSSKVSNNDNIQNDFLKENINKILKRNNKFDSKRKKFYKKDEKKNNIMNSDIINNFFNYNGNKLEELLRKIPKHKNIGRNKSIIQLEPYKQKTFSDKRTKKENIFRNKISSVMPPNNLKEIDLKKEMNFLFD